MGIKDQLSAEPFKVRCNAPIHYEGKDPAALDELEAMLEMAS